MASFWNKRKQDVSTASSYIRATEAVSRPAAALMTVIGILTVGGLLFGIFMGTRWAYSKLSGNDGVDTVTTTQTTPSSGTTTESSSSSTNNTPAQPVTVTSSTSTATPNTSTSTPSTSLPNTGPGSQLPLFFGIALVSYFIYHRRSARE